MCKYRPNWYSARMEGKLLPYATNQNSLLAFEAPNTMEVDISVYQPSLRCGVGGRGRGRRRGEGGGGEREEGRGMGDDIAISLPCVTLRGKLLELR